MPELAALLSHHPDRAAFPPKAFDVLAELGQDPSCVVLAWELAALVPDLEPDTRRRLFAVALALLGTQAQGHTRMALVPEPGSAADLLLKACGLEGLDLRAFLAGPDLAPLVGLPGEAKPLLVAGDWLYTERFLAFERSLAARARALDAAARLTSQPVGEGVFSDPVALNEEQRRGVQLALEGPLTLITGGPGTGKTSIVVAILRALLRQPGLELGAVLLAAPTGKAAQRMGEAIRGSLLRMKAPEAADRPLLEAPLEPRTLHRLLAWNPVDEAFRHGPDNPLAAQVLIVDEASMISQEHLHRLLASLAPGARLVLLGDADQLPSVEAGCAFRDLVAGLEGACVRLRQSYRMSESDPDGRNILSVARGINAPEGGSLWEGPEPIADRDGPETLAFRKVERLEPGGKAGMEAFLRRWFESQVCSDPALLVDARRTYTWAEGAWGEGDEAALRRVFGHFDGFRILCALREAADLRGVEGINALLHRWMRPLTGEGLHGAAFCPGEPVLMTTNDYRRGIFNGDQGIVLKVRLDGELRQAVVFPRLQGFTPFLVEPLRPHLEHAYAMTIHKSQGSEYARIAVVLPRTNHRALTRELLYTGLTRAKKSVVLLAERERLPFAAGNPSRRSSGLEEALRAEAALPAGA